MDEFNDTLLDIGVDDLRYGGCQFTWHNSRTIGHILRKLDRVLVNASWLNSFPNSSAEFLPFGVSDHSAAVVRLELCMHSYITPFKFFNFWAGFEEFLPLVEMIWSSRVEGHAMFRVCKKLKLLKSALRNLCGRKNAACYGDLVVLRSELNVLQAAIAAGNQTADLIDKERACAMKLSLACKGRECYDRQKSRIQWLREGDHNSAFFFNSIKSRINVNKILSIQDDSGVWIHDKLQISNEVVEFFKGLLGSECSIAYEGIDSLKPFVNQVLCSDQIRNLGSPFSNDDIKKAMFSLHPNKSPGPDGFNAFFFQKTWHIVGDEVTSAILDFFANGLLLKEVNCTTIVLIPKIPNASKLKDYRPISCCNTIYKCITKLIANRLKDVLPSFVNEAQAAFVHGRHIGDNILMAQELVRGYHLHSSSPKCALKIDLRKAFDSVRWDFLWDSLKLLGFPSMFIGWIRSCVSSAKFSVAINGELNGFFEGRKGIRQGDPISPYLFVICMDIFSRILTSKILECPSFKYHWRCRKSKISHLCFADDLMIFCHGDLPSIMVVKDALDTFSSLSGLTPNVAKCSIFLSGVNGHMQQDILNYLGFPLGSFPIRYLGVPLISTKLCANDCQALVDRILGRIKVWTNRFLSYAGRVQLIQSVLFSIQSYWCAHFILPAKVTKAIESILSAFLWSGVSLKSSGAKVAWADISTPKAEGGLGIKKIKDWNIASMTRYIWLLCNPCSSSLWAAWVKLNLLHKEHFWVAKVPWNCSWTWRRLLKIRDRVKPFISVKVGNGDSTSLWFDVWRPQGPICTSPHARVIVDSGLTVDAKVSAIISSGHWMWPPANSSELISLKVDSRSLDLPICSHNDKVMWDGSNDFTIKKAWNVLRSPSHRVTWAHLVWFKHHVPRHSFILWLAIRGRLPSQDRLLSFGLISHMKCFFCLEDVEDHNHLFFACSFSSRVWSAIACRCDLLHFPSSWETLWPRLCDNLKGTSLISIIRRLALGATIYYLWTERNSRKHGRILHNEQRIISQIMETIRHKLDGSEFPLNSPNRHLIQIWHLPASLLR